MLTQARKQIPNTQGSFTSFAGWKIPQETRSRVEEALCGKQETELTLGHIDNDGRLLSRFGELPGFELVQQADFVPRYRYSLDLVLIGDRVLIRKDFRGDRSAFHREWLALATLGGHSNAPALHQAREDRLVLTKNFVPGATMRSLLVSAGARILTVDTRDDPKLLELAPRDRTEAVWARGRDRFGDCLEMGFLDQLEELINTLHQQGITGSSLTFGNVVRHSTTGEPWVIDFDGAETHKETQSIRFEYARDSDRELFNRIYGRQLVTRRDAARVLRENLSTNYAPIDLGMGLATPGFWSVDSGTGRWEYLNGRVLTPLLQGKRILDLGSHNGIMPLMMLRAGAREVVGVERSPELVAAAQKLKRLIEWRDMRHYDLHIHCADMLDVLTEDWGAFDLVTAFCSLYYLNEDDMTRVAQRAAELAPILVLQAKIDTPGQRSRRQGKEVLSLFLQRATGFRGLWPHRGPPPTRLFETPSSSRMIPMRDSSV